jgi:prophage regulatory protein
MMVVAREQGMVRTQRSILASSSPASSSESGQRAQSSDDKFDASRKANGRHETRTSQHFFRRTIRRSELRQLVPLADTTIYEMEQRGEFPRRFYLTSRCVVWDLAEVEAWIEQRRVASDAARIKLAPAPDVRLRKTRPVKPQALD